MGCITSKGVSVTRSMSIRQELSHGFHTRSAVWEDLLTSNGGNDHLFAFVRSDSDSDSDSKTKSTTFTLPSSDVMTKGINAAPVEALVLIHSDSSKFTRSKSCHALRETQLLTSDSQDKNRSLSFHTVEEYDALLERIRGSRNLENFQHRFPWDDDDDYVDFQVSSSLSEGRDKDERCNEATSVEDSAATEEGKHETGSKRKAIAKGLKSLDVEFPAAVGMGKLKQRMLVEAQYVTPKFGSYNDPATHTQQKSSQEEEDDTVFSPELLAAFEDCMQQPAARRRHHSQAYGSHRSKCIIHVKSPNYTSNYENFIFAFNE